MIYKDSDTGKVVLYRPKGCDLLYLINSNKILDGDLKDYFLKVKKKRPDDHYNLTKAYIFLTRLMWGELSQRYFHEAKHWVNLSSDSLKKVLGDGGALLKVKRLLKGLKIIEENDRYLPDKVNGRGFSKSYRFADDWQGVRRERLPEPYYITDAVNRNFYNQTKPKVEAVTDVEQFLLSNLKKITIADEATDYILNQRHYRSEDARIYAENYLDSIRALGGDDVEFSRAESTGRLSTVLTRIHKDARHWLRYEGEILFEVDIVGSQPFFLGALYSDEAKESAAVFGCTNLGEEQDKWFSLWDSGDVYEAFRVVPALRELDRDSIKSAFVQGGLNAQSPYKARPEQRAVAKALMDAFEQDFPILYSIIHRLKTVRDAEQFPKLNGDNAGKEKVFSQFALKMQRIESTIIIDYACVDLMKQKVFVYTVHDAIGCLEKDVETVEAAIVRATERYMGRTPKLKAAHQPLKL